MLLAMLNGAAAQDAALAVTPLNTRPGPVYQSAARLYQGVAGIARDDKSGRLWATWYSGGRGETVENYVLVVTSGDDGATWSEPVLVVDPPNPVRTFNSCLWTSPDGRRRDDEATIAHQQSDRTAMSEPLGLRQPAAAFRLTACCETTSPEASPPSSDSPSSSLQLFTFQSCLSLREGSCPAAGCLAIESGSRLPKSYGIIGNQVSAAEVSMVIRASLPTASCYFGIAQTTVGVK